MHQDRISPSTGKKTFVCYRTWRRRAFCVLEFFASYLSRRQSFPVLLVQSPTEKPKWISTGEAQKLAVGMSIFSCCEMNHPNGMVCSKTASWDILESMIKSKVKYDHDVLDIVVYARFTFVLGSWWKRGLKSSHEDVVSSLKDFKTQLRWDMECGDGDCIDREGVSLLMYASIYGSLNIVAEILQLIPASNTKKRQTNWLDHRVRQEGYVNVGIPGQTNALFAAMAWGTPEIVALLLQSGANPNVKDHNGADPFMYACYYGRNANITLWLKQFKDWNVHRGNYATGANALTLALSQGPNKFETMKILLNSGIDVTRSASSGVTNLMAACSNEDADINVVNFLLSSVGSDPNIQARPRGVRWTFIRYITFSMTKLRLARRGGFAEHIANGLGTTALHYGARRGDVEIVELLLSRGASPNVKNRLGIDAASLCGSFPELKRMLLKKQQ